MKVVKLDTRRGKVASIQAHSVEQSLARYCRFFEKLEPDDFDLFPSFYHYRVRYSSPLHDVNGSDKIKSIFDELVHRCEAPKLVVRDYAVNGQHGFIYWKFFRNAEDSRCPVVTGLSRIKFDGYGRIISHRDIWDTGSAPRNRMHQWRDWWRGLFSRKSKPGKRAAPPKEFHGSPPF